MPSRGSLLGPLALATALLACSRERVSLGTLIGGAGGGSEGGGGDAPYGDCGAQVTPVPHEERTADVLISLEHSGRMKAPFGAGTRLSAAESVLRKLVLSYGDRVRFGYEEFPKNTAASACPGAAQCCGDAVTVPPAPDNYAAIDKALRPCMGASDGSCSEVRVNVPTADGLRIIREFYAASTDGVKERYVLLTASGAPNCAAPGADACAAAVAEVGKLLGAGVKTIVLAASDEPANACLEDLAGAGGAPRPGGPPSYYLAKDPAALDAALGEVVYGIARPPCFLDLASPPRDPSMVAVFFDGVQVPLDASRVDGWGFAAGSETRIEIYGSWCALLQGFGVKEIAVEAGCAPCAGTAHCP